MTSMHDEKVVAGLSCGQVLDVLSDYLDDDLSPDTRRQVEEHLKGCEGCARFGGEFGATVRALRAHLASGGLPDAVRDRLRKAMDGGAQDV